MVNIPLHGEPGASYVALAEQFDGNPDLADALSCEMCQALVGLATGDGEYPTRHVLHYAVHLAGDTGDTLFCEDCYGWVSNAAPTITNAVLRGLLRLGVQRRTHDHQRQPLRRTPPP